MGTAWRDALAAAVRASREYAAVCAGFAETCAVTRAARRDAERRERAAREAIVGVRDVNRNSNFLKETAALIITLSYYFSTADVCDSLV